MNLPDYPGGPTRRDAGNLFLKEISRSNRLLKPKHIIGLTAYEDSLSSSQKTFTDNLWSLILYNEIETVWKQKLTNKITYILAAYSEQRGAGSSSYDYDVAIITALKEPELQQIETISTNWKSVRHFQDTTEYQTCELMGKDGCPMKIVAASTYQMGFVASIYLASKIVHHFKPKLLIMAGIAAGVRGESNYGDILVAEQSWDYNSGKIIAVEDEKDEFLPDPNSLPIRPTLRDLISTLKSRRTYLDKIKSEWKGKATDHPINIHLGPMLSGSAVIATSSLMRRLKKTGSRKIIGIDMETYGVYFVADNAFPPPLFLSIKSVCDFADEAKDDKYQQYAAYTSARYIKKFIECEYDSTWR